MNSKQLAFEPGLLEFGEVLKADIMRSTGVSMPGVIKSYNAARRTAEVLPMFSRMDKMGKANPMPLLVDVPVHVLRGGDVHVSLPVQDGDECLLIVSDSDIDTWFATGSQQPPPTDRSHSIADCFAIVGFTSVTKPVVSSIGVAEGGLGEKSAVPGLGAKVAIDPVTHKITISNSPVQNLGVVLDAFLTTLMGSADPTVVSAATAAKPLLQGLLY